MPTRTQIRKYTQTLTANQPKREMQQNENLTN